MSERNGPSISNSHGANILNAVGNNNVLIANRNSNSDTAALTKEEAIETLGKIEEIIVSTKALEKDDQMSILKYLEIAKSELSTKESSKNIVSGVLEKVEKVLKSLSNISDSAASLWETVAPHLKDVMVFVGRIAGNFIA